MRGNEQRTGRRPAADGSELGRELVRLGPLWATSTGRGMLVMAGMVALLLVAVAVAFGVLVTLAVLREDPALGFTGAAVAIIALPIFGVCMAVAVLALRATLVVHERGLVATQGVGRSLMIRWDEVGELIPPSRPGKYVAFMARLTSGKRVGIARLRLNPRRAPDGTYRQHPDTQMVLEHYARWCRDQGRRAAIRESAVYGL